MPKILVIDDDPTVHDLINRQIGEKGYQIISALNGKEGLELAKEHKPNIITLDVLMPEMDGWSSLSQIKADNELCEIPVVMMTMTDDEAMGYALGASDYITKPVDWNKLSETLERLKVNIKSQILIVEDDPSTRDLTKKILEKEGWNVAEAENGKIGIEQIQNNIPGLILLDIMMPEMNGFEFINEIQKNTEWMKIPIVVVTSKDLSREEKKLLQGNVEMVLQKGSFGNKDLIQKVNEIIDNEKT